MEKIQIIFEDKDLMVLKKPAGVTVTSEGVKRGGTVEDWLADNFPKSVVLKRNGIVHRLDKGTSGLMVVAKSKAALEGLLKLFKERKVIKRYLAMIEGETPQEGEVKAPIGRHEKFFGRWRVRPEGKLAETKFRVIKRYIYGGRKYSLVEVELKTGRTHQIRVHFCYLGWPLVGDTVYGGKKLEALERPFLHAAHLEFDHPISFRHLVFDDKIDKDLEELIKTFDEKN